MMLWQNAQVEQRRRECRPQCQHHPDHADTCFGPAQALMKRRVYVLVDL
jgi:hypothetical protein